ncbi:MAG: type 1 glutamine amidotransferase [Pseudomonadota bacterium]
MIQPKKLRLGLLLTGETPPALAHVGPPGGHAGLYARWLGDLVDLTIVPVLDGETPGPPDSQDGWIVTGSAAAVYEDHAWIPPLEDFVRTAAQTRPVLGVCFGHQLLAQAFGGRVVKADAGWGVGVMPYAPTETPGWLARRSGLNMYAMHQDQVVAPPPGATAHATSDFCPIASFSIGERVLGVQFHPEFDADYLGALITYRACKLGEARAQAARQSLNRAADDLRDDLLDWLRRGRSQP